MRTFIKETYGKGGAPILSLLLILSIFCAVPSFGQSTVGTDTNLNLSLDVKSSVGQIGGDAWTAIKGLNFSQGFNAGLLAVKDGSQYGVGMEISTALTNSPIQAGFAILGLEQPDHSLALYDSSFNLSVSTRELIPIVNIPVDLIIGSGPGIRFQNGTTVIEQSFAFAEFHWRFTSKARLDTGFGVIHLSDKAKALPSVNAALTWRF